MKKVFTVKILGTKESLWENVESFINLLKINLSEEEFNNIKYIKNESILPLKALMQISFHWQGNTINALVNYGTEETLLLYKNISTWSLLFLNGRLTMSNIN